MSHEHANVLFAMVRWLFGGAYFSYTCMSVPASAAMQHTEVKHAQAGIQYTSAMSNRQRALHAAHNMLVSMWWQVLSYSVSPHG